MKQFIKYLDESVEELKSMAKPTKPLKDKRSDCCQLLGLVRAEQRKLGEMEEILIQMIDKIKN